MVFLMTYDANRLVFLPYFYVKFYNQKVRSENNNYFFKWILRYAFFGGFSEGDDA